MLQESSQPSTGVVRSEVKPAIGPVESFHTRTAASVLALILICLPMAIGSMLAFPLWDDAWFWLMVKENGPGGILPSQADRPVMGSVWFLVGIVDPEFWRGATLIQTLFWIALGIMSAQLWEFLFPALQRFAWVVGCLAAAPIVSTVQMIPINIGLGQLLSVVLSYAAAVLLLYSIRATDWRGTAALVASIPILAFGTLVTEYTLPAVVVMVVLCSANAWRSSDRDAGRRAWRATAAAVAVTAAAYTVYTLVSDRSVRAGGDESHPSHIFTVFDQNALRLPFNLAFGAWHSLAGGLMRALGTINLASKLGVLAAAYGALVGGLLVYGSRRGPAVAVSNNVERRNVVTLGVAFLLGMAPLVAMGRVPWNPVDQVDSRYELPLLPATACLIVFFAVRLVRPQLWAIPVFAIGLLAGNASLADAWAAISERQQLPRMGAAIRPYVSPADGYTVAAVAMLDRGFGPRRPYELVARLTADWPPELRRRFWAYRHDATPLGYLKEQEAQAIFGTRGSCVPPREVAWELRLLKRTGPLHNLIWVAERSDGSIVVEPYCVSHDNVDRSQGRGSRVQTIDSTSRE